ncbi:MAG: class I SAM-dependent methyltransferase family protein [Nanoarchaeota archaeon]|nr:class I SAM-dependent methyltransferase family protein [Nanoarchaeota archaeon]
MVLTLKIKKSSAEKIKKILITNNLYNRRFATTSDTHHVFFPITDEKQVKQIIKSPIFIEKNLKTILKKTNLKETLKNVLTKLELQHLKTAYDILGDMAIIEIDEILVKKQKLIGDTLLKINSSIKTVAKKVGIHSGVFRLQKLKIIAGRKNKIITYKENNALLKFNPEKVYFSARLSTERKRIYNLVKPGEFILVMFSGCAPYPVILSKNTEAEEIIGVEINPDAHKYALGNLKLNKIKNVKLFNGDVKDIIPKLKTKFDRILMPLPKSAEDFLPIALLASKKGTIIHFYDFLNDKEFNKAKQKVKNACKRANIKYKSLNLVKCGQHAPHVYRICFDFKIL